MLLVRCSHVHGTQSTQPSPTRSLSSNEEPVVVRCFVRAASRLQLQTPERSALSTSVQSRWWLVNFLSSTAGCSYYHHCRLCRRQSNANFNETGSHWTPRVPAPREVRTLPRKSENCILLREDHYPVAFLRNATTVDPLADQVIWMK